MVVKIAKGETFWLIAPYAAWMALMMALPSAPWAYAARTLVTLALLSHAQRFIRKSLPASFREVVRSAAWGVAVGLAVLAIWILPDRFAWYRSLCVIGDPYAHAVALSLASPFTKLQLFGSAFVIPVAEELFFRKWLIRYAGFWWMVGLFAVEHNRPAVAAICGILYGVLYLKKGLLAAIVAHVTTNFLLGLFVLQYQRWEFW